MENKRAKDLLEDAKISEALESLIEKTGPDPELMAKANYDLQAAKAKMVQIKNEKEALEAKERKTYYKMKVKDMELQQRQQSGVSESALQIKNAEKDLAKARHDFIEKKEEVKEMKDPIAIVKEEGEVIATMNGKSVPLSKSGVTVIKLGHDDKEQLEPKVGAPDPEKDPEFDGPADPSKQAEAMVTFAESMREIFSILREEGDAPIGEMPAVQSHESDKKEEQKLPSEEPVKSAEVHADAQPEILVTDTSIRIEIPVHKGEKPVEELGAEAGEAMVEALRVVYEILGGKNLNEAEDGSVELPADAKAEVKIEGDKMIVEIPVERPVEEVSKDEAEALKEAALVLASVLKEQELGSAAAEPVHTDAKPVEHTPVADNKEIIKGQHAEEVKEVIVEAKKLPAALKKNMFDDPKDADKIPEKLEKKALKEEEKASVEPKASPEGSVVPSVEDTDTEEQPAEGQGMVEVTPSDEAEVTVSDDKIRIEVQLKDKEAEMPEVSEKKSEQIAESIRTILGLLSPKSLKEEESAEISKKDAEAEISIEDGKLVIEIEADKPSQEVSDEMAAELSESISALVESLMDEIKPEKISKDLNDKNELHASEDLEKNKVDNSKREEGNKKAEEIIAPIVEASEPAKPEHSVDQQYDVHAALKVDMNPAKHAKEHDIKVDSAEHKAEPKDITVKNDIKPGEEAEYRSLKEALLLEDGYFETPSVSTVTPEQKQQKLVGQVSLLIARESADPLYEELLNAAATARHLQSELSEKYKAVAQKRVKQIVDSKSKKPEETQASALAIVEFLDAVGSGRELNEGIGDWVKGKLLMGIVKFLPEQVIDRMIMKAHSKALSMVKGDEERKLVENEFSRYLKDKRDKIEFLRSLISKAPEDEKKKADEKVKAIASKVAQAVKQESAKGVPVNASYEAIVSGQFDTELNERIKPPLVFPRPDEAFDLMKWIAGIFTSGTQAVTAFFAGPIGAGIIGAIIALALAGVAVLVAKIIDKIRKGLEDPYGEVFGN